MLRPPDLRRRGSLPPDGVSDGGEMLGGMVEVQDLHELASRLAEGGGAVVPDPVGTIADQGDELSAGGRDPGADAMGIEPGPEGGAGLNLRLAATRSRGLWSQTADETGSASRQRSPP